MFPNGPHLSDEQLLARILTKPKAYDYFPTVDQWRQWSRAGGTGPPYRRQDPGLIWIDTLVDACNRAKGKITGPYLYGELFLATVHWLNHYKLDTCMDNRRQPAIQSLNFTVAKQLETALKCPWQSVGKRLYEIFGRALSGHGARMDRTTDQYLTGAQREQWRVIFEGGQAKTHATQSDPKGQPQLLDTYPWKRQSALIGTRCNEPGDCGFVLGMNNELYIAPFATLTNQNVILSEDQLKEWKEKGILSPFKSGKPPVYHSSFMHGDPVQCSGRISVKQGAVSYLNNFSGHYMPAKTSMVRVLILLKSVGMDLKKIVVDTGEDDEELPVEKSKNPNGEVFLEGEGKWDLLQQATVEPTWMRYNKALGWENSRDAALWFMVKERFRSHKVSKGGPSFDRETWKQTYEAVCRDLALFDSGFQVLVKQDWRLLGTKACNDVNNRYLKLKQTKTALEARRELIEERREALKRRLTIETGGKVYDSKAVWEEAWEDVCWDLAIFEPLRYFEADHPPPAPVT